MNPNTNNNYFRIVLATDGVWRAYQVQAAIKAIDSLACRLAIVSTIGEIVSRYEAQFSTWRAFGLLTRHPSNWGESDQGTEALVRNDYLEFSNALRQHGLTLRHTDLSWNIEFAVEDLLELVPTSSRLEIEFIQMGSPGLMSFLMAGFKAAPKFNDVLIHLINHLFHFKDMRRLMKLAVRYNQARTRVEEALANQELAKIKLDYLKLLEEQRKQAAVGLASSAQLDSSPTLQGQSQSLLEAGCSPQDIQKLVKEPTEKNLDVLCRLKCEGLIIGMGAEEARSDMETE